jgi:hypothetical protein
MVVSWEKEVRACIIEEMIAIPTNPELEDEKKEEMISSLLEFFPIRDPAPGWWNQYASWFRTRRDPDPVGAWLRFLRVIEDHEDELGETMADLQMNDSDDSDESEYEEGNRLYMLPPFFVDKFERISTKVVNEWMLHKQDRSLYDPGLIIRVAVYQMQTNNDTGWTFLDLLHAYVQYAIEATIN